MKSEQDDKWLEAMIRRAVGSEEAQFDADRWKKKFHHEVESLQSRNKPTATPGHSGRRSWRSIMSKRSSKIAASAAIAAGLVVAVFMFATGDGSTLAMAAVLEQLQTKCYKFEIRVQTTDGASSSSTGMVLEPGKMRLEASGDLGAITSVIDNDAGQSLLLFHRSTAAYRFDWKEAKPIEVFGFLILPMRSMEDLWGLKAGDETSLGKKDIAGKSCEGFQVTQENDKYVQTIAVWADAKAGHPLEVEIVLQSDEEGRVELTLSDFRVIPDPNAALFSTEVPEGYILANSQTLKQLTAKSDTAGSTTDNTSTQAKSVLDAIALWADGNEQQAVELLVTVDWNEDFRFGQEHHFFTMSERQFGTLVLADREKVSAGTTTHTRRCRDIYRKLLDLGRKARAAGNVAQAEKYFTTAVRFGGLLNRDSEMMLIVRMAGIAIQKNALTELTSLYEEQGETEKLQNTQAQTSQIEEQLQQIKEGLQGVPAP